MPRGATSQADLTLIADLSAHQVHVSPYQLERWRRAGWSCLRPARRRLGRGRGSTSCYRAEALPIAAALAAATAQGRPLAIATVALFMCGMQIDERPLRDALCWVVDSDKRCYERMRNDHEFENRHIRRAKANVLSHPLLLDYEFDEEPRGIHRTDRASRRRDLRKAAGQAADLALYDEAPASDEVEDFLRLVGMDETAVAVGDAIRAREFAGIEASSTGNSAIGRQLAKEIPIRRFYAARSIMAIWNFVYLQLFVAAASGEPTARETLAALENDESATWFRWVIGSPRRVTPTAYAHMLLTFAADERTVDACWDYARALLPGSLIAVDNLSGRDEGSEPDLVRAVEEVRSSEASDWRDIPFEAASPPPASVSEIIEQVRLVRFAPRRWSP